MVHNMHHNHRWLQIDKSSQALAWLWLRFMNKQLQQMSSDLWYSLRFQDYELRLFVLENTIDFIKISTKFLNRLSTVNKYET